MTVSYKDFRNQMDVYVNQAIQHHHVLTVKHDDAKAFVIMSEQDYGSMQETMYVLSNPILMRQISDSLSTHKHTIRSLDDFKRN
jgi:antitoxin YefM